ncbi:protein kinase-like protein [Pseudonocardia hierapolitana]|uniref:Protein kinase-like protein n=1 Tax=Pseudonocardia hierapolitana TaxID=1128676 RepID=A0A561SL81_9PSEU|nr:protein kinase-like protein [Pseudonocardia hierapolitana]
MPSDPVRVTDVAGVEFTLGERIAKGAQGTVYRVVRHPDYAIKLLEREQDLKRIATVRRLPLDDLAVAAPLTLIREGGAGYVMRLAGDMKPLREQYLPREFGRGDNPAWYLRTGGLRRRLAIAANVARTLAELHARGLAYVDLNPNNVMVSDDLQRDNTWLIDTDNLTSLSDPRSEILGFPGYLAPERNPRKASPPSTLADAYSLGVLVFRMLVLTHPLMGFAADEMDGNEAQKAADRGELPYIGDPLDDTNRLADGSLPALLFELVLSGRLKELCRDTFGPGRLAPAKRPGSSRWRDVLHTALDNVVECRDGCGWTFYRSRPQCPNCGATAGSTVLVTVYGGDLEQPLAARDSFVLSPQMDVDLLPRHAWGRHTSDDAVVTFRPEREGFAVLSHGESRVVDASGRDVRRLPTPRAKEVVRVRLETPGLPDRVLALRSIGAA